MAKIILFFIGVGWASFMQAGEFPVVKHPFIKSSQAITFPAISDHRFDDAPFSLVATASSGLAVSFSVVAGPATLSGNQLSITGIGQVTIQASQAGNSDFQAASSVNQSFQVNKANQSITFAKLPNRTLLDSPFTVNATASSGLPVELSVASGPAIVSGDTVTLTGTGLVTIRAYQAGNKNYNSAPYVNQSFMASKSDQRIIFNGLVDRIQGEADFTLTATSTSALPVAYGIYYGPAVLTGTTVRLTGFGKVRVEASQTGNAYYNPVAVDTFFCVLPVKPYITVEDGVLISSSLTKNQWFYEGNPIAGATTRALTATRNGHYSVQVANPDVDCNASAVSDVVAIYLTAADEEPATTWQIYPNPARDQLLVTLPSKNTTQASQLTLYAPTGQLIQTKQYLAGTMKLALATDILPAGLYLLEIRSGNQTLRQKIVIAH